MKSLENSAEFLAHQIIEFATDGRMSHQFNITGSRESDDAIQFALLDVCGEIEEIIRDDVVARQPTIDHPAVSPI
jgi:hypothetical protein